MPRRGMFVPYRPKRILNKQKRPDHWFWTRYTAHPYIGCQHGCEFCYCRERKYYPFDDINDFPFIIKVKENAPILLRKELAARGVKTDLVFTGDYQPAERQYRLSRKMLEVCRDRNFPVFVLERSPLVLRDLDLLKEINEGAIAAVAFSIITTPDSPSYQMVRRIERLAPLPEKRFEAMAKIAAAGLLTGTCMMPVLPMVSDDEKTLRSVVQWTADHGGSFVLVGGLTLADQQRDLFIKFLGGNFPGLVDPYRALYPLSNYGMPHEKGRQIGLQVKEYCQQVGIRDRMPRPIIPGDGRTLNKRIAEELANRAYYLELGGAAESEIWANRKAAWAIEDTEQELGLLYRMMGVKGLESIRDVGPQMAGVIKDLIEKARAFVPSAGKVKRFAIQDSRLQ